MIISKTIKLAWLNIIGNAKRSIMTLLTMALGGAALIVIGGFMEFTFEGLRETTIRTQLGHFQIYAKDYRENVLKDPYEYLIQDSSSLENQLKDVDDVALITQRLYFNGLITKGNRSFTASFVGVNAKKEELLSSFEVIVDGINIYDDNKPQAVVGVELAKALDLEVGDVLTILTNTIDGAINAIDIEVVGIAQTGAKEYDKVFVKIPLKFVQQALNTDSIASLIVLLNDTNNVLKAEKQINNILKQHGDAYEYATWLDLAEFYKGVHNIYTGFFNVFSFTIFIIIFFSIYSAISISIFERTSEIGTLRAIGFSKKDIFMIFFTESIVFGILGSILATILAIIVAFGVNSFGGIYIAPPPGQNVGYIAEISIVPYIILRTIILSVVISCISAIYPSYVAFNKNIIKAINND